MDDLRVGTLYEVLSITWMEFRIPCWIPLALKQSLYFLIKKYSTTFEFTLPTYCAVGAQIFGFVVTVYGHPYCSALDGCSFSWGRWRKSYSNAWHPSRRSVLDSLLVDRRIRQNDYRHRSAPSWLSSRTLRSWTVSTLRGKFSAIPLAVAVNDDRLVSFPTL